MTRSYNSKAILYTACRKSLLNTVVNITIYRLTNTKPVFSLQQQKDELGIGLYRLRLWCSQSRRFTKPMCYFLSSVIFYVVLLPQYLCTLISPALSMCAVCHRNDFKVFFNVNANKFLFSWFIPEQESSRRNSSGCALLNAKLNAQVDACVFFFLISCHSCFSIILLLILPVFQCLAVKILHFKAMAPTFVEYFVNFTLICSYTHTRLTILQE